MLIAEIEQSLDEGAAIPQKIMRRVQELDPVTDAWNLTEIDDIWNQLDLLERNSELSLNEPNDLADIREITGKSASRLDTTPIVKDLRQRIEGAWRGRLAGCALGLPYERLGCTVENGRNVGLNRVTEHLRLTSNFPMVDYAKSIPDPDVSWGTKSLSATLSGMEPDDDIHFTIANLFVFEAHGIDFTWREIADWWLSNLAITEFCTAEVQALLNYAALTARWGSDGGARSAATPHHTRRYRNPYREWIGAQIRSDFWGWVAPLDPHLATDFAFRDSHWTHERNGIYGAMFFSALQSLAFGACDINTLVQEALTFIPPRSRLALAVTSTLEIANSSPNWDSAISCLLNHLNDNRQKDLSPVHTINNAAICVLSLLFGSDDPFHAARLAVMSGLDTDCNGATVGAILGVIHGNEVSNYPLVKRLGDDVSTRISSFPHFTVPDLVDRTMSAIGLIERSTSV